MDQRTRHLASSAEVAVAQLALERELAASQRDDMPANGVTAYRWRQRALEAEERVMRAEVDADLHEKRALNLERALFSNRRPMGGEDWVILGVTWGVLLLVGAAVGSWLS